MPIIGVVMVTSMVGCPGVGRGVGCGVGVGKSKNHLILDSVDFLYSRQNSLAEHANMYIIKHFINSNFVSNRS